MIVYHGTFLEAAKSIETDGILLSKCKNHTDFGKGFYVSPHIEYAKNTALKKSKSSKKYGMILVPVIVKLEYDENKGKNLEHHFEKEDTDWLQFIVNNRNGERYVSKVGSDLHNLDSKYEIVSGRIADQDIVLLAGSLKSSPRLVNSQDVIATKYINNIYADQISFHTPLALRCLTYMEYELL